MIEDVAQRRERWIEEDMAFERRDGFLSGLCIGLILGGLISIVVIFFVAVVM